MTYQFRLREEPIELDPEIHESGELFAEKIDDSELLREEQEDGEFELEANPYLEASDRAGLEGWLGEWEMRLTRNATQRH